MLLLIESFDTYTSAAGNVAQDYMAKWRSSGSGSQMTITSAAGRRGTKAMVFAADDLAQWLGYLLPDALHTSLIMGFAIKHAAFQTTSDWFLEIAEPGIQHVTFNTNNGGFIQAYRGNPNTGTLLGTSSIAMSANTFHYVEILTRISNTAGDIIVRIDGVEALTFGSPAALDTQNGGTGYIHRVRITGNTSATITFDDIYILDETGTTNNWFLGDVRVDAYLPSANGNSSDFTGSDGNSTDNYLLVDDATSDDDSTYVESSTVGQKDTYQFPAMSHTPDTNAFFGVQVHVMARKPYGGLRSLCAVARSGSTELDGTSTPLVDDTRRGVVQVYETDPNTAGSQWTKTTFEAAEFGMKVTV